ncbi:ABC transporter ATP-binding protein [Rhodococcus opacus]|uniref:ABC transporter ATP-binding protein n=1 Tax=Rhodococcus opacus TaxID=37919 RepID=UPI00294A4393|nr:ABC transporter ATP-binding protein [Rhodococcus opacus]MDV6247039.1 ABC transporter ATP-binding protein [Rhodococcus opacus]
MKTAHPLAGAHHLDSDQTRPVLEVEHCSIDFDTDNGVFRAVNDVSLTMSAGEKIMLLGPSGCGKSTLLKSIGGFIPMAEGKIKLNGVPVGRPGPDRILVFQDVNQLFPWQTVRKNVAFAAREVLGCGKREALEKADHYLKITGLAEFADFYPHALSGGMKQRGAIARAFVVDPSVLLMDEPFGALDAQTRLVLQRELNVLWQKTQTSIIFVTHSIDEAVRLGHRIVVMGRDPGRIIAVVDNTELQDIFAADMEADPAEAATVRRDLRELLHQARGESDRRTT